MAGSPSGSLFSKLRAPTIVRGYFDSSVSVKSVKLSSAHLEGGEVGEH